MGRRIWLSEPWLTGQEEGYIQRAFSINEITQFGDNLNEFHKLTQEYVGGDYCLHVNSATAGIHLIMRYLGVGPGGYVLCSSLTFAASCNPAKYLGAELIFVDSDEETYNMSPKALKKALEWAKKEGIKIKAAVIVDIYGQPANYDELLPILESEGIPTIEDSAEAQGSVYKGRKCGTLCDFGVFSYDSNKMITTSGGGTIISKNKEAIDKMRYWSTQARELLPYYEHKDYGYQYRMSNILAGIGCAQIQKIDTFVERRREIHRRYKEAFADYKVSFVKEIEGVYANCWLTVMNIDDSCTEEVLALINHLEASNIETRMCWKPMHLQPVYEDCKYFTDGDKDVSKAFFETGICLPSAAVMTDEEQDFVIGAIKEFMDRR